VEDFSMSELDKQQPFGIILADDDTQTTIQDGGPGSGNHGHAGIPGKQGGSAPKGSRAYIPAKPSQPLPPGVAGEAEVAAAEAQRVAAAEAFSTQQALNGDPGTQIETEYGAPMTINTATLGELSEGFTSGRTFQPKTGDMQMQQWLNSKASPKSAANFAAMEKRTAEANEKSSVITITPITADPNYGKEINTDPFSRVQNDVYDSSSAEAERKRPEEKMVWQAAQHSVLDQRAAKSQEITVPVYKTDPKTGAKYKAYESKTVGEVKQLSEPSREKIAKPAAELGQTRKTIKKQEAVVKRSATDFAEANANLTNVENKALAKVNGARMQKGLEPVGAEALLRVQGKEFAPERAAVKKARVEAKKAETAFMSAVKTQDANVETYMKQRETLQAARAEVRNSPEGRVLLMKHGKDRFDRTMANKGTSGKTDLDKDIYAMTATDKIPGKPGAAAQYPLMKEIVPGFTTGGYTNPKEAKDVALSANKGDEYFSYKVEKDGSITQLTKKAKEGESLNLTLQTDFETGKKGIFAIKTSELTKEAAHYVKQDTTTGDREYYPMKSGEHAGETRVRFKNVPVAPSSGKQPESIAIGGSVSKTHQLSTDRTTPAAPRIKAVKQRKETTISVNTPKLVTEGFYQSKEKSQATGVKWTSAMQKAYAKAYEKARADGKSAAAAQKAAQNAAGVKDEMPTEAFDMFTAYGVVIGEK
jgi:hypothetical protein